VAKQNSRKRKKSASPSGPISGLQAWIQGLRANREQQAQARRLLAWSLLFACLISIIACISYFYTGNADQSAAEEGVQRAAEISNWLGFIGAKLAEHIVRRGFGVFGFVLLLYGVFLALVLMENEAAYYLYARRVVKYVLFITLFGSVFFSYIEILADSSAYDLGGGFGYSVNMLAFSYVGKFGMAMLILFALVLFGAINFNAEIRASRLLARLPETARHFRLPKVPRPAQQAASPAKASSPAKTKASRSKAAPPAESEPEERPLPAVSPRATPSPSAKTPPTVGEEISFDLNERNPNPKRKAEPASNDELELIIETPKEEPKVSPHRELEVVGEDNIGKVKDSEEETYEKVVPEDSQELENAEELFTDEDFDPTLELSDYEKPPLELLDDHGSGRGREVNRQELEENKNKILKTLEDYGIKITSIKATIGPTVTLYEIVPAPGVRISKIKNLEDDIALSLAALGIRIIAPIPGQGTIGIEVPNSTPEIVSLRGVLTTERFMTHKGELPIALGRTISNEVYIADLNKMPHLLIAGATGQGKSVGLNTVIASLLYKKHPGEVKFVLIDPKKVEMNLYQLLRLHFMAQLPQQEDEPIVTDVRDAVDVLKSLCVEMDNRYDLLKKARVRNLKEYNQKFTKRKLSPRKGHRFLPYIILVIDELADMMMTAGKEVEMPIARLAQLARAVGIHLVVATQRPSVNVITGIIKANFPARMSYRVISKVDSRTILDANGADQLIGRGDMLLSTGSEIIRLQNAFIDTHEVERIVEHIGRQRGFLEPYYLPELPSEDGDDSDEDEPFEKDGRFDEAARLIVKYQIGSASLIQRKMKLGYNRAGRIIDQLEKAKIVGPHSGSKPRDVLVSDEAMLEEYLQNL